MSDFVDSTGSTPADATAQPAAPAISGPPAEPAATPLGTSPATTAPDRGEAMVPSYRLRETREAAIREAQAQFQQAQQQWADERAAYQAQMEQIQRQLHALVGVTPNQNQEADTIRQQFAQLYPGLAALEDRAQDIFGLVDRSGDLDLQSRHYWQNYGVQSMDRLYSLAEKSLGSPLSQEGKRALHAGFVGYISSSKDLVERYTSDRTLVDEYWQLMSGALIDPVRRAATATVQQETAPRALPQDRPAGVPNPRPGPKPKDLDERAASGWAAYEAMKKKSTP